MIPSPYRLLLREQARALRGQLTLKQGVDALRARLLFLEAHPTPDQVDALAAVIFQENDAAYRSRLTLEAAKLHLTLSGRLDPLTIVGLQHKALVSAQQITNTYMGRYRKAVDRGEDMTAWVQEYADHRAPVVQRYESDRTSGNAFADFYRQNSVVGTAHVEPTTHAIEDMCPEYIDLGEVGLSVALQFTLPAHNECDHDWLATLADTSGMLDGTPGQSNLAPGLLAGITWAGGLAVTPTGGADGTQQ